MPALILLMSLLLSALAFDPADVHEARDGDHVAMHQPGGRIDVWHEAERSLVASVEAPADLDALALGGETLAATGPEGTWIWSLRTAALLLHVPRSGSLRISDDGRFVAVGNLLLQVPAPPPDRG